MEPTFLILHVQLIPNTVNRLTYMSQFVVVDKSSDGQSETGQKVQKYKWY